MNILYINLDRAEDRNKTMINYFNLHNLNYIRIEAIDGIKLNYDNNYRIEISNLLNIPVEKLSPNYFLKKQNFMCLERDIDIIMNKVACSLSHYYAVKTALDNNFKNILILEDDIIFDENLNLNLNDIPDNCDILYLGGWIKHTKKDPNYLQNKTQQYIKINNEFIKVWGGFSYYLPTVESIYNIYSLHQRCFIDGKPRKKNIEEPNRVLMFITDCMYVNYIQKKNCYLLNPPLFLPNRNLSSSISYKKSYKNIQNKLLDCY